MKKSPPAKKGFTFTDLIYFYKIVLDYNAVKKHFCNANKKKKPRKTLRTKYLGNEKMKEMKENKINAKVKEMKENKRNERKRKKMK
jgi:hypothetical protein